MREILTPDCPTRGVGTTPPRGAMVSHGQVWWPDFIDAKIDI
jgi:hypothetical protein